MNISYIRAIQNAKDSSGKQETLVEYNKRKLKRSYEENLENMHLLRYPTEDDYVSISIHRQKQEDWGWYLMSNALLDMDVADGDTFYDEKYKDYFIIMNMQRTMHYWDFDLVHCNWIMKWQNESHVICEQPCVVISASQYNSGEKSNAVLTLGSNQVMVRMQLNDETIKFKSDKRMFIDNNTGNPKPYRITRADTVSKAGGKRGIIELLFTEDVVNVETDSIEKFICDYEQESTKEIQVSYKGEATIRKSGVKTFTSNVPVVWEVNEPYITIVSMDDTTLKIKCADDNSVVGKEFTVMADTLAVNMKVVGLL